MSTLNKEITAQLKEVDWHVLVKRLLLVTEFEMRKKGIYRRNLWKSPTDYVHEAVLSLLQGNRRWNPNETSLLNFLHGVVRSSMSHDMQKSIKTNVNVFYEGHGHRDQDDDDQITNVETLPDPRSETYSAEHRVYEKEWPEQLKGQLREMGVDALAISLVDLALEKDLHTPKEWAEYLHRPVSEINNAQRRLRRALARIRKLVYDAREQSNKHEG